MRFPGSATAPLLVLSVALACSGSAQAEGVRWLTSPTAAVAAAAKEQRLIVVYVTGSYCSHCRRMDRDTWADRSIQRTVGSGFIPLKLEAERDAETIERLGVQGVPVTLIVGSDRRIRSTAKGYVEPRQLQNWLNRYAAEVDMESK